MTEEQHLSVDAIADLLDGSLPATEAMGANSHLATCEACAAVRDDQAFVAALLAEEAADPLAMPLDIAVALDAALTRAADERAATAVPFEPVRRRRAARPVLRWVAGAAATVAVLGLGVAALQSIDTGGDNGSSSAGGPEATSRSFDSVGAQAGSGSATVPSKGPSLPTGIENGHIQRLRGVSPSAVPGAARRLAAHPGSRLSPELNGCSKPIAANLSTVVLWHGRVAILALNTSTRTASILDCRTAVHSLYTTGY